MPFIRNKIDDRLWWNERTRGWGPIDEATCYIGEQMAQVEPGPLGEWAQKPSRHHAVEMVSEQSALVVETAVYLLTDDELAELAALPDDGSREDWLNAPGRLADRTTTEIDEITDTLSVEVYLPGEKK